MLAAVVASTVLTLTCYRLVTPRGWALRAQLSNRGRLIDGLLVIGFTILWGFLLTTFLTPATPP